MNKIEYLLTVLSEECGEVVQANCKILRFGGDNHNPQDPTVSNIELMIKEINDILGVIELLEEEGVNVSRVGNREDIEKKKEKVKKFMEYSTNIGRLK